MSRPAALLGSIALLAGACTPYAHVTGGYTKSTGPRDGLTGGALNAHAGVNLLDLGASPTPAAGLSVRTRATSRLGQGAIGPDAAVRFLLHTHGDGGATPPITPMEVYDGLLVGFGWLKVTRRGPGGGAFFGK